MHLRHLLLRFFSKNKTQKHGMRGSPSAALDKQRKKHCGCADSGETGQGPGNPARWSHRRVAQLGLVHVHPCCRVQPERLNPDLQLKVKRCVQREDESGLGESSRWSRQRSARPKLVHDTHVLSTTSTCISTCELRLALYVWAYLSAWVSIVFHGNPKSFVVPFI